MLLEPTLSPANFWDFLPQIGLLPSASVLGTVGFGKGKKTHFGIQKM
jgi:hypothetical protein